MGRVSDARDRLVCAAGRLIHERGYASVSVSDICTQAGLKKGSFYHFFGSKLELVLEALEQHAAAQRVRVATVLQGPGSAREKLRAMFRATGEGMSACHAANGEIRGCPMGNLALEMAHREPAIREKVSGVFKQWQSGIQSVLLAGVASGEFKLDDAEVVAERLIAYLEGSILLAKATDDPSVFCRLVRGADAILDGACSASGAAPE